ncbi:protein MODIFIER OF SNC1 1 isoform X2 [Andrographis paniculata]|uniref:protein MODIFIER OF SNC1 1 isoform X2 n=1 Tax=Andrographis paniculata TaxID=175694 RepID=UPI0021E74976|nr:protein MODIFIER OF SNC1 1 isoform X2 [Andrographis paniculata]
MNSNMMAGERRWASARRGGMTVLGKVAVPKPLNLPSQRLENHGLDPNVEIVPKGTLSWGSRPSSSGSNPWISSTSPNADGGTVSPNHLSGRPSSGGSGTRPSTAGSDKAQESVGNAWGSNSRPSSASGTLSSSQTSTATLRPRSADNRPNSSQLSRFAEPATKGSVAWGPSGTAERLGVKPKEDEFSLTSGDFPTLGSEKDNIGRNVESGDCCRPSSASGRIPQIKDDMKHGTVNTWRPDGTRITEDDVHPNMEEWHAEHHQYMKTNAPPQHFDAWHGPPANGPPGVWYGGRPRAPAFGAPAPPGGFPAEPFPYYHPQMPPPRMAGSQPVPHRGPGPRGPHPKNGDFYRPQMHDTYARPGMPFRPGFYPPPPGPMAFESFYGPPMGYCNNERDIPYMGMAPGPPLYTGYAAGRPDIGDPHGRVGGHQVGNTPGQMEADYLEDPQGSKRAPLRKHNEYDDQRDEGDSQKNTMQPNATYPGKNLLPMISKTNEWGAEVDAEESISSKKAMPNEISSLNFGHQVHSGDIMKVKSFEGTGNANAVNDYSRNESGDEPSFRPEILSHGSEKDSSKSAVAIKSVLMHKIDGLNAKVRVFDGRNDGPSAYNRDVDKDKSGTVDSKSNNNTGEVGNTEHLQRNPYPKSISSGQHEVDGPVSDKPIQSNAVVSRRTSHGRQGRVDQRGRGKFSQDPDGWRKKPPNTDSLNEVLASSIEPEPSIKAHLPNVAVEASETSLINPTDRLEVDSVETYDSSDSQRTKMRELAKQRALQLQKEEEERTREQKAKALAKLEELNRRMSTGEAGSQKDEQVEVTGDIQRKQGLLAGGESVVADQMSQAPGLNLVSNPSGTFADDDNNAKKAEENTNPLESSITPVLTHEDARDKAQKESSQVNNEGISRHKRTGYKQKTNNSSQKSLNEIPVSKAASDTQKDPFAAAAGDTTIFRDESNVSNPSSILAEPSSGHQRRKNNRSNKNKHKVAENSTNLALPQVLSDPNAKKGHAQGSVPSEEMHGRGSNQWKPNTVRKIPRTQQFNRSMGKLHSNDTAVWAPVPTQNKSKGSVSETLNFMQECPADAGQNSILESANPTKGDNAGQSSLRSKRAEMERYVPKPVAKELAQQGSVQPSSTKSSRSTEVPGKEQSGSAEYVGTQPVWSNVENDGNGHHSKPKNDLGIWKQMGSADISLVTGLQFGAIPASEINRDIQQSKESSQLVKVEINSSSADPKSSGNINTLGSDTLLDNPTTVSGNKYSSSRDHGATGRGKRHPPRGYRTTGKNPDSETGFGVEPDGSSIHSAAPNVNHTDRPVVSKENRTIGERTSSQWQPKSQTHSTNTQQGNRTESETHVINRPAKKDNSHRKVQPAHSHDNESVNASQPKQGESANVESNTAEAIIGHHQETSREKPAPARRRPFSPNQDSVDSGELVPNAHTDYQVDHNIPSGSRRNARQNSRFSKGHESRNDWSASHDNTRPHNPPSYRDRQRQNVHYEYQPVGHPADRASESMDRRHWERGQNHHPKRGGGNYYRRQTQTGGSVHTDSQE